MLKFERKDKTISQKQISAFSQVIYFEFAHDRMSGCVQGWVADRTCVYAPWKTNAREEQVAVMKKGFRVRRRVPIHCVVRIFAGYPEIAWKVSAVPFRLSIVLRDFYYSIPQHYHRASLLVISSRLLCFFFVVLGCSHLSSFSIFPHSPSTFVFLAYLLFFFFLVFLVSRGIILLCEIILKIYLFYIYENIAVEHFLHLFYFCQSVFISIGNKMYN